MAMISPFGDHATLFAVPVWASSPVGVVAVDVTGLYPVVDDIEEVLSLGCSALQAMIEMDSIDSMTIRLRFCRTSNGLISRSSLEQGVF
jgi:hypothetical protein